MLALLYLNPERDYTLTEVAQAIDAGLKVVHTEAGRLSAAGLITETRRGRARLLRANMSTPVSHPLADLLAVTYGPLPVLTDLLAGIDGIQEAYIFGSWAARYLGKEGNVPHDIDVLVIGTPDRETVYDAASAAEGKLKREVNISFVTPEYWKSPNPADSFFSTVRERPLVKLELSR
jgi:predicted nucleotidyltransferase